MTVATGMTHDLNHLQRSLGPFCRVWGLGFRDPHADRQSIPERAASSPTSMALFYFTLFCFSFSRCLNVSFNPLTE